MDAERASQIVDEEFANFGGAAPVLTDSGELNDGSHWEPARLESEEALRAQCRAWIDSFD